MLDVPVKMQRESISDRYAKNRNVCMILIFLFKNMNMLIKLKITPIMTIIGNRITKICPILFFDLYISILLSMYKIKTKINFAISFQ